MTKKSKFAASTYVPPWALDPPKPAAANQKRLIAESLDAWSLMSSQLSVELHWVQPTPGVDVFETSLGDRKKLRVRLEPPKVELYDPYEPLLAPVQQPA